jgi:tetratricopeptide (TPR) repeat protein
MRVPLVLIGFVAAPAIVQAQAAPTVAAAAQEVQALAHAVVVGEDLREFAAARGAAERALASSPNDFLLLHYLGYLDFRIAALRLQTSAARSDEVRREVTGLLESGQSLLERSASVHPMAETYALLSAIHALRAATGPRLAILRNANRSREAMERALALGADNPRVKLIQGINSAQTPRASGGGGEKALPELTRALELYSTDPARAPFPTWGQAEAYAWLGVVHARAGRWELAREAYQNALRLEPQSRRVRDILMPRLERAAQ